MRYQVPQFVDIEDKIVGPLTLKQFLTYLMAVLLLIPVFLFSDLSLFITIALPALGVAAAVAHLKINGKSVLATGGYLVGYLTRGQLYIWRRSAADKPLAIDDSEVSAQSDASSLREQEQQLLTGGSIIDEDLTDPLVSD